jgi:glycine/D-amino acid oxidase-like deaminating enzyme
VSKRINIVGQGLAGSILAYTLKNKFVCDVVIYNNESLKTSSSVAAGIYNPITGKRLAKAWMADSIFPFMFDFFNEIESRFSIKLLYNHLVFKPFADIEEQNYWTSKSADEGYKNIIEIVENISDFEKAIPHSFGGIKINQSGRLDISLFLETIKAYFQNINSYVSVLKLPEFDKDEIVIFCEGAFAAQNPLWNWLPWQLNKGEILEVKIDELNLNNIINKSVFVMPIENKHFRVGSTYHREDFSPIPTQNGINELSEKLASFLEIQFQITDVKSGIRPAVQGRRPFLGQHPEYHNYYIFNGFGSKAVSLAPFFANHLAEHIINNQPLIAEVKIDRQVKW